MRVPDYQIARQRHLGDMLDRLQRLGVLRWRWDYADRRAIYWIALGAASAVSLIFGVMLTVCSFFWAPQGAVQSRYPPPD